MLRYNLRIKLTVWKCLKISKIITIDLATLTLGFSVFYLIMFKSQNTQKIHFLNVEKKMSKAMSSLLINYCVQNNLIYTLLLLSVIYSKKIDMINFGKIFAFSFKCTKNTRIKKKKDKTKICKCHAYLR